MKTLMYIGNIIALLVFMYATDERCTGNLCGTMHFLVIILTVINLYFFVKKLFLSIKKTKRKIRQMDRESIEMTNHILQSKKKNRQLKKEISKLEKKNQQTN